MKQFKIKITNPWLGTLILREISEISSESYTTRVCSVIDAEEDENKFRIGGYIIITNSESFQSFDFISSHVASAIKNDLSNLDSEVYFKLKK